MDEGHLEPVRHLFAATAEITETAHEAAIAGQSEALTARDYAEAARRLRGAAGASPPWPRPRRSSLARATAIPRTPPINCPERAGLARHGKRGWVVTRRATPDRNGRPPPRPDPPAGLAGVEAPRWQRRRTPKEALSD